MALGLSATTRGFRATPPVDSGASPRFMPRAGWRIIVPGHAQWAWGQRDRGVVLFGSFLAAVAVAVFGWGTPLGFVLLGFAYLTHVASVSDSLLQSAFPALGRKAAFAAASGGLAAGVYAPLILSAATFAWPSASSDSLPERYLVNCLAYHRRDPRRNEWVWYRPSPSSEPRLGRITAAEGQEIRWSEDRLRVDDRLTRTLGATFRSASAPREMAFRVPAAHLLVDDPRAASNPSHSDGPMIVPREWVMGRAWAVLYPIRDRRLLD